MPPMPEAARPIGAINAPVVLAPADFAEIQAIMQREARIALSAEKTVLVQSRLDKRLRRLGLSSYRDYLKVIEKNADERNAMVVALTTNHTHFFREAHHFDHLREVVLPELRQRAAAGWPVRIWSAGCSSGEEVYTATMCLLGPDRAQAQWARGGDVRLLATDLSPPVVAATERAVYSATSVKPVPEPYRRAWMQPHSEGFEMVAEAKALVTARVLNLFGAWPMTHHYDVIFCRNVMIYFDDTAKAELEQRLAERLRPGGYLYIGHSERLFGPATATMASCGQTIYCKRGPA